ncbi:MAG: hypothetical protein JXM70_22740 [Pirellulales bacterium]|nr:hypothetical protein [Pirellulales bacterium]
MNTRFASTIAIILMAVCASVQARHPQELRIFQDGWPRAFFFRSCEGPPSRRDFDYDLWSADYGRLMGIMGKCLDEEVLGRMKNNPAVFSRFKNEKPEQVVLLHLNGNSRDPRFQASNFFPGHWVYRMPAEIKGDIPAESGETTIKVDDARLFRVQAGRYATSNDDIALFKLKADGTYDWHYCEEVQLISVDTKANTIRVRRGQYGTRPLAFKAGESRAVAHQVEGPWGKNNNILWYYNLSDLCPRDREGKTAADRFIDDIARWFGPDGCLCAFDGLEFDVLFNVTHGDTNGDGIMDDGVIDGVNHYGIGVVEFLRKLRERMGHEFIIMGDGALGLGGMRSQRGWGYLNGIESEGWPNHSDWEVHDWSGGLNRHNFWKVNAHPPVFNYINHKYTEHIPGGPPGARGRPRVGFNIHRLVFAAGCFTDSAICYSFPPPRDPDGKFGVWDELRCGVENKLGWLGMPTGPAVHLATQSPDIIKSKPLGRLITGNVKLKPTADGLRMVPKKRAGKGFNFSIREIPTAGPDLTVAVVMKAEPMLGYPKTYARFVQLEASSGANLMAGGDPEVGMCIRKRGETLLQRKSGAFFQRKRLTIGGEQRNAFFVHPPYEGGKGYVYWAKDVLVGNNSVLKYSIGMGAKSPKRSDGVWFSVHASEITDGKPGAFKKLNETRWKKHKWLAQTIDLSPYGGKMVRLKFVADCGPQNNATTDHVYWSEILIIPKRADPDSLTVPERFMTWAGPQYFASSFYYRHIKSKTIDLTYHIEGWEPVTIKSMTVHNKPDAMYRIYEKGIVLANPGLEPYTFDLSRIAPGCTYRRLKATAKQDTKTNSGEDVGRTISLEPRDGLFLLKTN